MVAAPCCAQIWPLVAPCPTQVLWSFVFRLEEEDRDSHMPTGHFRLCALDIICWWKVARFSIARSTSCSKLCNTILSYTVTKPCQTLNLDICLFYFVHRPVSPLPVRRPQVPWAVISTFLTDYLATNAHLGVPGATAVLFSFGIGCFAGTAVGGYLGCQGCVGGSSWKDTCHKVLVTTGGVLTWT